MYITICVFVIVLLKPVRALCSKYKLLCSKSKTLMDANKLAHPSHLLLETHKTWLWDLLDYTMIKPSTRLWDLLEECQSTCLGLLLLYYSILFHLEHLGPYHSQSCLKPHFYANLSRVLGGFVQHLFCYHLFMHSISSASCALGKISFIDMCLVFSRL